MGLDQLGVLTVGTLVPKEGGHTLPSTSCLPFLPGLGSYRSSVAPKVITLGHIPCNMLSTRHSLAGWLQT